MMFQNKIKWFKAAAGDGRFLPGSQIQEIREIQRVHAPVMAKIAVMSGRLAGDLD
jgi:hypothetical protein